MIGDEVASIEMTLPPFVPVLPDRPHVDRGPGGWLREEAARIDSRTPWPPARRDRNVGWRSSVPYAEPALARPRFAAWLAEQLRRDLFR